jgi:flagellin
MSLNAVSNYAANVAHRNLQATDMQATKSLAKLSIGQRVVSARDDVASMAVGSRISAEVTGLRQAVVNAGQAQSMLQIADGAMSAVSDILTRMKTLAIQASSGNLSSTEREFVNVEFQSLLSEIDRIAGDTDFAGTKLMDGTISVTSAGDYEVADGVASITAQGVDANGTTGVTFAVSYTVAGTDGSGGVFQVTGNSQTYSGTIAADARNADGTLARGTTVTLTGTGTSPGSITIALNTAFDTASTHATVAITFAGTTELDLSFQLGTGTDSEDSLSFTLSAINNTALGVGTQDVTTQSSAASALEAVNSAIDLLNERRASVGAAQNRIEFAASNLSIQIENAEAARSTLLDLDIAAEMTKFTSKQILMQSGVAMLAQANQMPQNLLRLLQ